MNLSPFCTDLQKVRRDGCPDLDNFDPAKPGLVKKGYGALRAIQRELRECAIRSDCVNMRWWMIVRIDSDSDVPERQDSWHS